jgi:hypothetical protein
MGMRVVDKGHSSSNQQGQGPPNQGQQANNGRMQQMGARVSVVSRDAMGVMRGAANGRGGYDAGLVPRAPRYVNGRPVPSGNRVCRYFVAGECLRADCRFRSVGAHWSFFLVKTEKTNLDLIATTSNVPCADSGSAEPARSRRAASFCIICRRMWI